MVRRWRIQPEPSLSDPFIFVHVAERLPAASHPNNAIGGRGFRLEYRLTDLIDITVTGVGAQGDGLAPGPLFVPLTLGGERVRARRDGQRAELVELVEASAERVAPPCPHFGVCGGCALQHWDAAPYLLWKADLVRTAQCEEELSRLRADIEREESIQKQRHDAAYQRGREAVQFNVENKKIKDAEQLITKTQDRILLDYALRKESEAAMQEEMKRNADKEAALQYQKYLAELMVKETIPDARCGRRATTADSGQERDKEKEEGQRFAQKFLDEAAEAIQREKEAAAMRSMKNVDNRSQLQQQIDYRKYKEEMEKQE
eukprot:gene27202-35730_t